MKNDNKSFAFAENDPREDDPNLQTLRCSCMLCYAREDETQKLEALQKRVSWVENPKPLIVFACIMAAKRLGQKLLNSPLIAVIIAVVLGVTLGSLVPGRKLLLSRNIFINIILMTLLIMSALYIWNLLVSVGPTVAYGKELRKRRDSYKDDLLEIQCHEVSIQLVEERLKKLVLEGGVPEKYWNYGSEIWEYVHSRRADSLKEALNDLERDIFRAQMDMTTS